MQNKHSKGVKECIMIILCTVNNQREGYTPILKQVCWLNSAQSAYTMQYTYSNCACMYISYMYSYMYEVSSRDIPER